LKNFVSDNEDYSMDDLEVFFDIISENYSKMTDIVKSMESLGNLGDSKDLYISRDDQEFLTKKIDSFSGLLERLDKSFDSILGLLKE
jgi:hypothetical protein